MLHGNQVNRVASRRRLAWIAAGTLLTALLVSGGPVNAADEKPKTVAVFELQGAVTDQPKADDPLFGSVGAESLRSLVSRLEKAGNDQQVAAVVLLLGSAQLDVAQIEECHKALVALREKKPVYAHADSLTTGSYALLTGSKRLSVSPTGDCWVNGLYGEQMFLRGLLDLLGVQPDFLTCGDYKSAAEMFMRKEPSPAAAEMTNWLYDSLFASIVRIIADGRQVEQQQVRDWINRGLFTAASAKEQGLIDGVETRGELLALLKKEHGASIKLDRKYAKKTGPDVDLNNPFAALQLWAQILSGPTETRSTKNAIAVVHVDGPIMLGKSEASAFGSTEGAFSDTIRKALEQVADEPRIRGVVLRVNSPGGSATASEIILQAVRSVQSKKPVVVSMGGVAGSGGYYVACRADRIFADSTTLTGSIGVVAGKIATEQMWSKLGIAFHPVQRGDRAGILRSSRPFAADEKQELQAWMDEIYGVFKQHVEEGREGKLTRPIDELAGGRVYTGQQALDIGLVDQIGTLDDAIRHVAQEVKLEDYEIRSFPKAQNFLEQLVADLSPSKDKDDRRLSVGLWSSLKPLVQGLDPDRLRLVQQALLQLDHLQQERIMLTMPIWLTFE